MSVMAETSQLAIGPYVAMAAVGSALYARTAVCREALVVKVPGGDGDVGGVLGDGGSGEGEGDSGGGEGSTGISGLGSRGGGLGGNGEGGDNGMHAPQVTAQKCWILLHGSHGLNCPQLGSWS